MKHKNNKFYFAIFSVAIFMRWKVNSWFIRLERNLNRMWCLRRSNTQGVRFNLHLHLALDFATLRNGNTHTALISHRINRQSCVLIYFLWYKKRNLNMHVYTSYHAGITTSMGNCSVSVYFEFIMLVRDRIQTRQIRILLTVATTTFIFVALCSQLD